MEPLIQIVNPVESSGWDDAMRRWPEATVFHTQGWARALADVYGFTPCYAVCRDAGEVSAVMPLMEVRGWMRGTKAVALPFTDYCPALVTRPADLHCLFHEAFDLAHARGWQSVEFRGPVVTSHDSMAEARYFVHDLDLSGSPVDLWSRCRPDVRRAVRKAHQHHLQVHAGIDDSFIEDFCRLQTMTRRRHGLPPQPRAFFRALQRHVLQTGHGVVMTVSHNKKTVAAAIFLRFGERALFKYGASDVGAQALRPNDLLMWEGIRWAHAHGCHVLSLGKTHPDHEGLRRFKLGWGTRESTLEYYRFDVRTSAYVKGTRSLRRWQNELFKRMPPPVLEWTGKYLYRYAT